MLTLTVVETIHDHIQTPDGRRCRPVMRRVRIQETGAQLMLTEQEYIDMTLDGDYKVEFDLKILKDNDNQANNVG